MPNFHKISNIKFFKKLQFCKQFNSIQGLLANMNQFGQWKIGKCAPSIYDIFDPDFAT